MGAMATNFDVLPGGVAGISPKSENVKMFGITRYVHELHSMSHVVNVQLLLFALINIFLPMTLGLDIYFMRF